MSRTGRPLRTGRTALTPVFDTLRSLPFRRTRPRLVGGVAAGIAARTGLSVWAVRLGLVIASLLPVVGLGAYLAAWVLLPWEDGSIPVERWVTPRR